MLPQSMVHTVDGTHSRWYTQSMVHTVYGTQLMVHSRWYRVDSTTVNSTHSRWFTVNGT